MLDWCLPLCIHHHPYCLHDWSPTIGVAVGSSTAATVRDCINRLFVQIRRSTLLL